MRFYQLYLLLFLAISAKVFAQDTLSKKGIIVHLTTSDKHFDAIFGMTCKDSLVHPTDKRKTYIIELKNYEVYLTAYKSKKKKWSCKISDITGNKTMHKDCPEFYFVGGTLVIRLFTNPPVEQNGEKIYHIDIDPDSGKRIDRGLMKK